MVLCAATVVASSVTVGLGGPAAVATPPGSNGRIAYVGTAGVYVADADLANSALVLANGNHPSFSGDGTFVALDKWTGGSPDTQEIFRVDPDGTNPVQLTDDTTSDESPAVSPDGSRIAFVSFRDSALGELYVMDADGSDQVRLTDDAFSDSTPTWSPDGTQIAWSSQRGSWEIVVADADGSGQVELTDDPYTDLAPNWSPDGMRLAFHTNRAGGSDFEIYTITRDGTDPARITDDPAGDYRPVYSPDGTKLVWDSGRISASRLLVADVNGAGVAPLGSADVLEYGASWAPAVAIPTTGSVSGRAWDDGDADGIRGPGEPGLAGVAVRAFGSGENEVASTATEADGTYSFVDLPVDAYRIEFTTPAGRALSMVDQGGDDTVDSDADEAADGEPDNVWVTVNAGDAIDAVDAGYFVSASVSGNVFVDEDGDDVYDPGELELVTDIQLEGTDDRGRSINRHVFSDSPGGFTFEGLRPGTYWLLEDATDGYEDGPSIVGSLGGVAGLNTVTDIVVGPGDVGTGYRFAERDPAASGPTEVTTTSDHAPDGCTEADCTLREAILQANASPGTDTISFAIPEAELAPDVDGTGYRIRPTSPLPTLTDPVVVDGTTQAGWSGCSGSPVVQLLGDLAGAGADGLTISGGSSTVRGIAVGGFGNGTGVLLNGLGGNTVSCNHLGVVLGEDGPTALPNRYGLRVEARTGGDPDMIGSVDGLDSRTGNLVSGNVTGIRIEAGADGTTVLGNRIGTSSAGTVAVPNTDAGIESNADQVAIGSDDPTHRNLVSGNRIGVRVVGGQDVTVQGNYVGVDPSGTFPIGNEIGIFVEAVGTVVGGAGPDAGNVVSGNVSSDAVGAGVLAAGLETIVQGNTIGLASDGTDAIANQVGVLVVAPEALVGGDSPGTGNVISGNLGAGVQIDVAGSGSVVTGNWIGSDRAGTRAFPNGGDGVTVTGAVEVGVGTLAGGNRIAFNVGAGVAVAEGARVQIRRNSMSGNGGLGIDLAADGVTTNDAGDADTGPNDLQNHPDQLTAVHPGGRVTVSGRLDSGPGPYVIEVFSVDDCDPSGFGEADELVGHTTAVVGTEPAAFEVDLDQDVAGGHLALTATSDSGVTSELSSCAAVPAAVDMAPVADAQSLTTPVDTPLDITLTADDPEGQPVTFTVVAAPSHGTLTGTGASRTYTPAAGYTGPDSFTFVASDGLQQSEPVVVTIDVTPASDACASAVPGSAVAEAFPPADLRDGRTQSDTCIRLYAERQDVTLAAPLTVRGTAGDAFNAANRTLPVGTTVNSHIVHMDAVTSATTTLEGTWTFTEPVLGYAASSAQLSATDPQFGLTGQLVYDTGEVTRPIEPEDVVQLVDPYTVYFRLRTTGFADELRVFTGNLVPGTITVVKQVVASGPVPDFSFTGDIAGTISAGGPPLVAEMPEGTYTVSEQPVAGWSLTGLSCDDGDSTVDPPTATATVRLTAGEHVTCTFTNTELATIRVAKVARPDRPATFTGAVTGSIGDGGVLEAQVLPGGHSVTEAADPDGTLKAVVCDDGDSTGVVATRTATFRVTAGEVVTCTFTNEALADLRVTKMQNLPLSTSIANQAYRSEPMPAALGDVVGYLVRVTNEGSGTARGVQVVDDLPAAMVIDALPSGCDVTVNGDRSQRIACAFPDLRPGVTETFSFRARIVFGCRAEGIDGRWIPGQDTNFTPLTGTPAKDVIFGLLHADNVICGAGDGDHLYGGFGDDVIWGYGPDDAAGPVVNRASATTTTLEDDPADNEATVQADVAVGTDGTDMMFGAEGNDTLHGQAEIDIVRGNADDDVVFGNDGNDHLYGDLGADEIHGGSGADTASGDEGDDLIFGDDGKDTLLGNDGLDGLVGGGDDDTVRGQGDSDSLVGGGGNDLLFGGDSGDGIAGGEGNDRIDGDDGIGVLPGVDGPGLTWAPSFPEPEATPGSDTVYGDEGDDYIDGDEGGDNLFGGDGNDSIFGAAGQDVISGDGGRDFVNAGEGDLDQVYGDDGDDPWLDGGDGWDYVFGGAGKDRIDGDDTVAGAGDDFILGGDGDDTATADAGDDHVWGEDGEDTLNGGDGVDYVDGGAGNDPLVAAGDGGTSERPDQAFGGPGNDYLDGDDTSSGAGVDQLAGEDGEDHLSGDEGADQMAGDAGPDRLAGGSGDDQMWGGDAEDGLFGGTGNDVLNGEADNDRLEGQDGVDYIFGGPGEDNGTGGADTDVLYGQGQGDILNGDAGRDFLFGGDGTDTVLGGDGDDDLYGEADGDSIYGNAGLDKVWGSGGVDFIWGGDGADELRGESDGDYIYGDAGDDDVWGAGGIDRIWGGYGDDDLYGEADGDVISGDAGVDHVWGGDGGDSISGGDDRDFLWGEAGSDPISGNAGDDEISGGDDGDSILGGDGTDTVLGGGGADRIDGNAAGDVVWGGDGDDRIRGNEGDDQLYGELGTDTISGEDGTDAMTGGAGSDYLYGGIGSDIIYGEGSGDSSGAADLINGDDGDDKIFGQFGNDTLNGGNGADEIRGGDSGDTVTGGAGVDEVWGGDGDDSIRGNDGHDQLHGELGADTISGEDGFDTMTGGAGSDHLYGGIGNDIIYGEAFGDAWGAWDFINGDDGDDKIFGQFGNDTLNGGNGADEIRGGDDADEVTGGAGVDEVWGGDGNDKVWGGDGNDFIYGEAGRDTLLGEAGEDTISGSAGEDTIRGGDDGDKELSGGLDYDWIYGDAGNDRLDGGGAGGTTRDGKYNSLNGGAGEDVCSWGPGGSGANDEVRVGCEAAPSP